MKFNNPVLWSCLIYGLGVALAYFVAYQAINILEANNIVLPQEESPGLPLAYFFSAVVLLGVVLFLIPISRLRLLMAILFVALYSWGVFIVLAVLLPFYPALAIAAGIGLFWYFRPRVWLHNLVMILALVSVGAVFGLMLSPWAIVIMLAAISVYDIVAVRSGYMMWMARRLSESNTLPAFLLPRSLSNWNLSLHGEGFKHSIQGEAGEREFSLLGGGDIGFPLMLTVSVLSAYGFAGSLIVSASSLAGLVAAFLIQRRFLKGKAMPALPPIFVASLIGFLIVRLVFVPLQ
jgi:presenilin-like A22 family membrane protease